jgi:hypothetical protein
VRKNLQATVRKKGRFLQMAPESAGIHNRRRAKTLCFADIFCTKKFFAKKREKALTFKKLYPLYYIHNPLERRK